MSVDNLYDMEDLQESMPNWATRIQANKDIANSQTQRRALVTLAATVAAHKAVYIQASDGHANLAQSGVTLPALGIVNEAGNNGDQVRVITFGVVDDGSWGWTPGAVLAVDPASAGGLVALGSGAAFGPDLPIQVMAIALTATRIFVCPSAPLKLSYKPGSYTVSTKPATGVYGQTIWLSNAGSHGRLAYWSGDNIWRYVADETAV